MMNCILPVRMMTRLIRTYNFNEHLGNFISRSFSYWKFYGEERKYVMGMVTMQRMAKMVKI